jgi:putative transposase
MPLKRTSHSVYDLNYHLVLVTKYRRKVLFGQIEALVKAKVSEICTTYGWDLIVQEVMPDHIHLLVSAPPRVAPLTIAATLKSILARAVFVAFPTLKAQHFGKAGLFSDGCYYASAGGASLAVVKRYICNQKHP